MFLHVMTEGANGKDRERICELIVTRQELLRAIAAVDKSPKWGTEKGSGAFVCRSKPGQVLPADTPPCPC